MRSMQLERVYDEIIDDERQGTKDDRKAHHRRHVGVPCHKAFQKSGHDKYRHQAHHDFHPTHRAHFEGFNSGIRSRKENAVPDFKARRTSDHDR
jgi:hypothetical protein